MRTEHLDDYDLTIFDDEDDALEPYDGSDDISEIVEEVSEVQENSTVDSNEVVEKDKGVSEYTSSGADVAAEDNKVVGLNKIASDINMFQLSSKLSDSTIRIEIFETKLKKLVDANNLDYSKILFSFKEEDDVYITLVKRLYPSVEKLVSQLCSETTDNDRSVLIDLLGKVLFEVLRVELQSTPESDIDEDLDEEVNGAVKKVMDVYQDLFEVGFQLKPAYGVLTEDGCLTLRNGRTRVRKLPSLAKLYDIINSSCKGYLVQEPVKDTKDIREVRNINMISGVTYYPEFQLGNVFGVLGDVRVDSWSDFKVIVEPELKKNIKENLKSGNEISAIIEKLMTCIVISEFNSKSALQLRVNIGNNKVDKKLFISKYNARKNEVMQGIGDLYHCELLPSGVLEITLVFDKVAYNGIPLFAYKAVEALKCRGRKPKLSDMILGQDTSGKIYTTNLDKDAACLLLIGAGQRSGKGVLTLNILGTVLAEGSPMIYLDGKPDMAKVLWSLGAKYGIKPAVWDAYRSNGIRTGVGAPEDIVRENPGVFGILAYLKGLQLMMVAAMLASKGKKFSDKRPFFIFDEALVVQSSIRDHFMWISKLAKVKKSEEESVKWCKTVAEWAERLSSGLISIINSQLPMSGISTAWLFQSMQPTTWSQCDAEGIRGKFNILKQPIMSRTSIKILGRGTSDTEYGLSKVRENPIVSNRILSEGGRHFAITSNQKVTDMDSITVFKPYLVLNTAENGTQAVEELRKNISVDAWQVIAPEGNLHEGVGFEGFAKMLGTDAIQNLGLGRKYLEDIMRHIGLMGKYNSVDEYLYDASIDSFLSLGVMTQDDNLDNELEKDALAYTAENWEVGTENLDANVSNDTVSSNSEGTIDNSTSGSYTANSYNTDKTSNITFSNTENVDMIYDTSTSANIKKDFVVEDYVNSLRNKGTPSTQAQSMDGIYTNPSTSMNEASRIKNLYDKKLILTQNPFKTFGTSEKPMSCLNSLRMMSAYLMQGIKDMVGHFDRVNSVKITHSGLVINDILFCPKFEKDVIDSLPYDIKNEVIRGNIIEMFDFNNLYRFKHLQELSIDDVRLAEGRLRRELCIKPSKPWTVLFKNFKYLKELCIGGRRITDGTSAEEYNKNEKAGYDFTEKLKSAVGVGNILDSTRLERMWNSKPVKVATGALGWTLGIKGLTLAASMFGIWGIVFGAFAVGKAIKK